MSKQWYCRLMGSELGPYTSAQLVDLARKRTLAQDDPVRQGNSDWVPAYKVKGLFEAAAKPAAKPKDEPPTRDAAEIANEVIHAVERAENQVKWFCIAHGEKLGPMPFEDLQGFVNSGALRPTDRVWTTSSPKWSQAAQVNGLQF